LKINPLVTSENIFIDEDTLLNNYTITNETFLFPVSNPYHIYSSKKFKLKAIHAQIKHGIINPINIDLISCNANHSNLFFNNLIANNFYCLNLTNVINKNITNFTFNDNNISKSFIYFTIEFDDDYLNSLNETFKKSFLEEVRYFHYVWPESTFSPNNYNNALKTQINFNNMQISHDIKYSNVLKFTETKLEQDENLFFENIQKVNSILHISNQFQYYTPRRSQLEPLVEFYVFLDGLTYNRYLRIYKKLPQILAEVLGIMEYLMLAFSFIVKFLTNYNFDYYLVNNFLWYFSKEKNKDNSLIWKYENYQDLKNIFKHKFFSNIENKDSNVIKNVSKLNENDLIEKNISDSVSINRKKEDISENQPINSNEVIDYTKKNPISINKKINNSISGINYDNMELGNFNNQNKSINDRKKDLYKKDIEQGEFSNSISCIKNNYLIKVKEFNENMFESFKNKTAYKTDFPNTGFIQYYFSFIIPKNIKNYYLWMNYNKALKHFSQKIFEKLDISYYLKIVKTHKILKNRIFTMNKEKEVNKFLSKSLYFIRDIDIETLVKEIK